MSEMSETTPATELSYAEATSELSSILAELNSESLDVDELVSRVSRARDLIGACRSRLASAKLDIAEITAELEAST